MEHAEFRIGLEFTFADRTWRCTDVGTRTILAIRVDQVEKVTTDGVTKVQTVMTRNEAEADGWFNGPPYAVAEIVFDEDAFEGCELE